MLVILHGLFKRLTCLQRCIRIKLLDPDYINNLKYSHENRFKSRASIDIVKIKLPEPASEALVKPALKKELNNRRKSSVADSVTSFGRFCCCLFSSQKNDFYQLSHRRSTASSMLDARTGSRRFSKNLNFLKKFSPNNLTNNSLLAQRAMSDYSLKTKQFDENFNIENYKTIDSNKTAEINVNLNDISSSRQSETNNHQNEEHKKCSFEQDEIRKCVDLDPNLASEKDIENVAKSNSKLNKIVFSVEDND